MPRTKKAVASKNTCELAPKEQRNSIGAAAMSDIHAMAANSKTKQCKICKLVAFQIFSLVYNCSPPTMTDCFFNLTFINSEPNSQLQ